MEAKKEIRKTIKKLRTLLSSETRERYSEQIFQRLISHPLYQDAEEIYCYASFGEEVSTIAILTHALRHGKKVAVPKILGNGAMEFFYINSQQELCAGTYGIKEPITNNQAQGTCALVVVPEVAFDKKGGRIGYGKGYYDVYLCKNPTYHTIALAYEIQCVDCIPTEPHDVRLEWILTEKETYQC